MLRRVYRKALILSLSPFGHVEFQSCKAALKIANSFEQKTQSFVPSFKESGKNSTQKVI
jgi:hypothetical protein